MKPATANLFLLIAFVLILIGGVLVSYNTIVNRINSCTANPLRYYADKSAEEENFSYSFISFNIYLKKYDLIPIKTIQIDLNKEINYPLP